MASVYRYGALRNCSPLWNDFWWCMRTNQGRMSDQAREEAVRKRYALKEKGLRAGHSSEEVWEERRWLVDRPWEPMDGGQSEG